MKKIFIFFIIFSAFYIASVNALNVISESEEYIIKKGDTLWDISESKLEDPFLWPKLWNVNPQIKNPDLIYPGDKIRIPSREELMRMLAIPEEEIPVVAEPEPELPAEVEPVVEVPVEIPPKYIVNKNLYIASGWISGEFPGIGYIINAPTGRTIFGKDDIVYLNINEGATSDESRFFAIRDVKIVKHPKTGEILGHQIRVTGILEIIGKDSNLPKAKINASFEELQTGDGLIPFHEKAPPIVPDIVRTPEIEGYIVESYTNSRMTNANNIIYLDKGRNDGLETGDIFSVFSETPVERPIGTIQIISLQPTTSAALILESRQEITIGDMWGKK